ncbi:MAG TPA: heterodisulfide reductase-related iron-sulfur binding cluster [Longimicrobiales bacterium]
MTTTTQRPGPAAVLAAEEERLLACVHCGFCLTACPTYTRLGDEADSPRGRLYLMRAVAEGRLDAGAEAFATHIDRCLGCRACETVCPAGVQYGFLLERARAAAREAGAQSGGRAAAWLLRVFASAGATRAAMAAGRWLRATGLPRVLARRLPARLARVRFGLAMLAASAPGLRRMGDAGRTGASASSPRPAGGPEGRVEGPRVAVLAGCVQEGLFSRVNRATVAVLEANGCAVVRAPGQRCCGALHAHGGDLDRARALARANVDAFERSGAEWIIVNAAGCGAAMKEYGELLAGEPAYAERARALAGRVRDVAEFLVELGPVRGAALPVRVTYDAPCHLHHAQRITRAPLELLAAIPELELVPLPGADECCGGAGIYGLLHPELGGRILADKVAAVKATGAEVVATPNPGCMMQIGAGLALAGEATAVVHPIELLAESYRRAGLVRE